VSTRAILENLQRELCRLECQRAAQIVALCTAQRDLNVLEQSLRVLRQRIAVIEEASNA
jgi:hypothetical protein